MTSPPTALAALGRTAIEAAGAAGVDVDALLAATKLGREQLSEMDGRIETTALLALWEAAAERSGDPSFGLHVGERLVSAKTIHVVGYVARNCNTLGACYERTERFGRLTNEASEISLRVEGDEAIMRVGPMLGTPPWPRCYSEMAMAAYLSLGRRWSGVAFPARRATFMHPAPSDTSEYERLFGAVAFGAAKNELVLAAETLELPLLEPDPALREYLDLRAQVLLESLAKANKGDFETSVRRAIDEDLGDGAATLESVAKRLGTSSRTLQRRLADEKLTFSALVDDVRKGMALGLIENAKLSVFEIAAMVGYQDAPSFRAAFLRWTGMTPRDYRQSRSK